MLADESTLTLVREDAEADRHLLDDVEHRNEQELGKDHPVAPFGSRLGGRYEASGIGVGEHHYEAGTPDGQDPG